MEAELSRLTEAISVIERRLADVERLVAGLSPLAAEVPDGSGPAHTIQPRPLSTREELEVAAPFETLPAPAAVPPTAQARPMGEAPPGLGLGAGLAGRTLLALGGGFLLRAITDGALLPPAAGAALGLVYALLWSALAEHAARRGRTRSAVAHASTTALLGFPLAWEITVRFGLLPPLGAVLLAGGLAALLLLLALRHALPLLAVVAVAAAGACTLAISVGARQPEPAAFLWALLAPAVAVLVRRRGWRAAAWLGIAAAALSFAIVDLGVFIERAPVPPRAGLTLQVLLVAMTLAATEWLVHRASDRSWALLGWALAGVGVVLGYTAAIAVARALLPSALPAIGLGSLAVAVPLLARQAGLPARAARWAALPDAHAERLSGTLALVFLAGGSGALWATQAGLAWSLAGVAMCALAWRKAHRPALLDAAALAALAALGGGLASTVSRAFAGPATGAWDGATIPGVVAPLAAAATVVALPACSSARHGAWPDWSEAAARLVAFTVALVGGGAVLLRAVEAAIDLDPGALAAARTATLALLAVLAAGLSRTDRLRHAGWLVYPLFVATAIKVVLEDIPNGRPATLFASLACFGLALLIAPRLARRRGPA
jgi:hypothetical protein